MFLIRRFNASIPIITVVSTNLLLMILSVLLLQACRPNETKERDVKGPVLEDNAIAKESVDEYNARKRAEALKADSLKKVKNSRSKKIERKRAGAWYEGGTLHQSKISDWKKSTEENRLATCADFIAKARKISNINELLAKSVGLRACITEATKGLPSTDNEKVSDVAVLCIIQLGY